VTGWRQPMIRHLYIHVPFCAAKCHYCAFYSEAGNAETMGAYVSALCAEIDRWADRLRPRTIFFGGGTPSLLPAGLMAQVLGRVRDRIPLDDLQEWTIECNPSTVTTEKARLFREHGVNRISMGVQSLDDDLLDKLGRVHSVSAAESSYRKLRAAGFENVNLDLIFGLPGQTMDHWRTTLGRVMDWQPEHISAYCLILEEDTAYWSLLQQGLICPDEELELAMYETGIDMLKAGGYRQYEVSNFAKPGRECVHNCAYWRVDDFLGLGPSACSTVGEDRWQNAPDTARYIESMRTGTSARCFEERVTDSLRASERAAFGMRMNEGVPAGLLKGRWDRQVAELLSAELVQWRHDRLQPTRRGMLMADMVAAEFL
jgi:oxygen-independent coproporphyrinogen-3 oxidase